ncbi:MAG: formylglycine-generating enzyme family protein [Gammaproteobacteria bacterium]|nr:formylglycine-generating enzyme family protein [Gammaproteobacteria bacterium]
MTLTINNTLKKAALVTVLVAGASPFAIHAALEAPMLPGGEFKTVVPFEEGKDYAIVERFRLDATPVTNGEFLEFVKKNPEWQRSHAPRLFAGEGYLGHWEDDTTLGNSVKANQPVTRVSWFAATEYCDAQGGRLPRWHEWEYAAAADEARTDARKDPQWRQRILAWYSIPSNRALPTVPYGEANAYGIHDLHGVMWEWVEDYNALLVSSDNREQGSADNLKFCGAGAVSMEQKENYAVLMRVAMLSSLEANSPTRDLGFRCAYDIKED